MSGKVGKTNADGEARLDRETIESLGLVTIETTTAFTNGRNVFEGVPLKAVLAYVGAQGTQLKAVARNEYETVIPLSDLQYDPILAMRMDGVALTARDKGPLWVVYPRDRFGSTLIGPNHDQKWVWQLLRLTVE